MEVNGWNLYCYRLFQEVLDLLESEVGEIIKKNPQNYQEHVQYKYLKVLYKCIVQEIPTQPNDPKYRIRKQTLEKREKARKNIGSWFRAKKDRSRIFFQFSESASSIVYAWINTEGVIRKAGAKNDVYKVFKRLLDRGVIPNDFSSLKKSSKPLKETKLIQPFPSSLSGKSKAKE